MEIEWHGERKSEQRKTKTEQVMQNYCSEFQLWSMENPASRLRLLAYALIAKPSLIFLFVRCSSLYTTPALSQFVSCPLSPTCTARPFFSFSVCQYSWRKSKDRNILCCQNNTTFIRSTRLFNLVYNVVMKLYSIIDENNSMQKIFSQEIYTEDVLQVCGRFRGP